MRWKLTEAQEQSVDSHRISAEENGWDEVSSEEDEADLGKRVMKEGAGEMLVEQLAGEVNVAAGGHAEWNQKLWQEEQEISRFVQGDDAQHVTHQQVECILGARQEILAVDGAHDVSVAVHESQEVLQAPAEASTAAQKRLRKFVVVLLQLLVEVLEDESNDAADGDDQRSEGQRAQVEAERLIDGAGEGEERNVVLAQRPIPAGEGSS